MGTEKGRDNRHGQMCAWKLMVCKEERKERRKEGRKEKVAMEMAGEIALQMDGWIDGNTRKHWGGVSGPHRSPAIVPVTSSHPDKRSLKHVWFL